MKKLFLCSLCHNGILGGGLYVDDTDKLRYQLHKTFTTASAAKTWLNTMLNVSATT